MEVQHLQTLVDDWVKKYGVRYFDEKTNTLLLMEEVGEFSRLIARIYGEQSFKNTASARTARQELEDEWGDILFVLICLANQTGMNVEEIMEKNLTKKTVRDATRHLENDKLKDQK